MSSAAAIADTTATTSPPTIATTTTASRYSSTSPSSDSELAVPLSSSVSSGSPIDAERQAGQLPPAC